MKIVLPVGKVNASALITTPQGIASWFPANCTGRVSPGEVIEFRWANGDREAFRVLALGPMRSSFRMEWRSGGELRYYLHGRATTLTLEVDYPPYEGGHDQPDP